MLLELTETEVDVVLEKVVMTLCNANFQNGKNDYFKFAVTITLSDGSIMFDVDIATQCFNHRYLGFWFLDISYNFNILFI